jgi:hypothetical protein
VRTEVAREPGRPQDPLRLCPDRRRLMHVSFAVEAHGEPTLKFGWDLLCALRWAEALRRRGALAVRVVGLVARA